MRVRVVALLTLILALALGAVACSSSGGDDDDNGGDPDVGDDVRLAQLEVGDCFDARRPGIVDEVELANCRDDHDWEVVALVEFDEDDDYPDEDDFEDEAADECDEDFDAFFAPDEDSWDDGDRILVCAISGEEEDDETPTEDEEDTPTEDEDTPTEDAATPTATQQSGGTNRPGDIVTIFDVNRGDCFDSLGDGRLEIVACSSSFQFMVTDLFDLDDGPFPGDAFFEAVFNSQCPGNSTTFVAPTANTWASGDREFVCLAEGGSGPGGNQPGDFVAFPDLEIDDCFFITDVGDAEIVACTSPFQFLVIDVFDVTGGSAFPGADALTDLANQECPSNATNFIAPSESTWQNGDRQITCMIEGDGSGGGGGGSMNQVVTFFDLFPGDCYIATDDPNLVELVSCNGPFESMVLDVLIVPDQAFPGAEFLRAYANDNCPVGTESFIPPSAGSWENGDREILCLVAG